MNSSRSEVANPKCDPRGCLFKSGRSEDGIDKLFALQLGRIKDPADPPESFKNLRLFIIKSSLIFVLN